MLSLLPGSRDDGAITQQRILMFEILIVPFNPYLPTHPQDAQ